MGENILVDIKEVPMYVEPCCAMKDTLSGCRISILQCQCQMVRIRIKSLAPITKGHHLAKTAVVETAGLSPQNRSSLGKIQEKPPWKKVSITPWLSNTVNQDVMNQLIHLPGESDFDGQRPAYDGKKNLYTAVLLPFKEKKFVICNAGLSRSCCQSSLKWVNLFQASAKNFFSPIEEVLEGLMVEVDLGGCIERHKIIGISDLPTSELMHILVNGRILDIPSYRCKPRDIIIVGDLPPTKPLGVSQVVASMGWPEVTKYRTLVSPQPKPDPVDHAGEREIIQNLFKEDDTEKGLDDKGMIREQLLAFEKSTRHRPWRIIMYRNGVSEGQCKKVLQNELDAIRKACSSIDES
ncbi:hypothetical protein L1049_007255 [Liquidambar formosana]|uniref:Piwi domain-containing protein n=1 Tax=Liquidambar formosana TaxID=63359 RepID=A0AAP0RIH9_LIQFO